MIFFKLFILFKNYYNFNHIGDLQIFNVMKSLILSLGIQISFISKVDFVSSLTNIINNNSYINLYFFVISELYMNSFSGLEKSIDSKIIGEDSRTISLQSALKKKS